VQVLGVVACAHEEGGGRVGADAEETQEVRAVPSQFGRTSAVNVASAWLHVQKERLN
jgi:hypothetical protein